MIEERTRRHSYEPSVSSSSLSPTTNAMTVVGGGTLTPDRSSRRLPTSKTPHHRTNFPQAYKPPVPHGYEPPPDPPHRYRHMFPEDSASYYEPATKAFAAALRGPNKDALSVTSDLPFDQAHDHNKAAHDDADSQPGRIKPAAATPPKHPPVRATTPTEMKPIAAASSNNNPVLGSATTFRSSSPVPGTSPPEIKHSSSYRSRSPGPMAPLEIRTTSSHRSRSPGPTPPPEIRSTVSPSPVSIRVPSSPSRSLQSNSTPSSPARQVASSPSAMPFDEAPTRVTPSPTNAAGGSAVNRSREIMQRSRGPPSPARASPLTTGYLMQKEVKSI